MTMDEKGNHEHQQQPPSCAVVESMPSQSSTSPSLVTVRLCGASQSECGYCHGRRASVVQKSPAESSVVAMGLWMEAAADQRHLLVQQNQQQVLQQQTTLYEQFVCRGWRRSGRYLYKPDNWASCCPAMTIRLKVQEFAPSKSQRRVVQKMKRLLEPPANTNQTTLNVSSSSSRRNPLPSKVSDKRLVSIQESDVMTLITDWTKDILQTYWMDRCETKEQAALPTWWSDIMPVTFKLQSNQKGKKQWNERPQQQKPSTHATTNSDCQSSTDHKPKKQRPMAASSLTTMITDEDDEHQRHQQQQQLQVWSTNVCAAMTGRSRGQLRQDDVSNHVAQALQLRWDHYVTNLDRKSLLQIHKIEAHNKSGHVLIHFVVVDDIRENINNNHERPMENDVTSAVVDDQDMPDSDKTVSNGKTLYRQKPAKQVNHVDNDEGDGNDDVLAAWWKTEASMRHGSWVWSQQQQQQARQGPHQLHVSTMSAWDSALDPDVFRLYTLYQHQVHDESDVLAYEYRDRDSGKMADDDDAMEREEGDPDNGSSDEPTGEEKWILQSQAMLETEFLRHCSSYPHRQERIRKAFDSFVHFLVDTPFSNGTPKSDENNHETKDERVKQVYSPGTYHQHYRIDGALVAVGVVDLLPQGLSSVYLFYHPSFSHKHVALGKYCSWKEIEFAQTCQVPFYYLGYYIESCPKMRYKAEYQPSELLCPVTYEWVDAKVAQCIIQSKSPVHHCCQLYYPPEPGLSKEPTNALKGSSIIDAARGSSPHHTCEANASAILQSIPLEVGFPHMVTLGMLQETARDIVSPLLQSLLDETSPQIVRQCVVKLV